jgi:hypothetical protein
MHVHLPMAKASLRVGPVVAAAAPPSTTVHVAGAVLDGGSYQIQRCSRCGRVLSAVMAAAIGAVPSFLSTGRLIADGPTSTYFIFNRALAPDERECDFVPAFAWE